MAGAYTAQIIGVEALVKKLNAETLVRDTVRPFWQKVGQVGLHNISGTAPVGFTGRLKAKLVMEVRETKRAIYVVVKTTATAAAPRGQKRSQLRHGAKGHSWRYPYSYPRRLEFDPRSKHKDWMLRGLQRSQSRVLAIMGDMARAIEAKWGRG